MDTDSLHDSVGSAIAIALASGHLDPSVILGCALGIVITSMLRPALRRLRAAATPHKPTVSPEPPAREAP